MAVVVTDGFRGTLGAVNNSVPISRDANYLNWTDATTKWYQGSTGAGLSGLSASTTYKADISNVGSGFSTPTRGTGTFTAEIACFGPLEQFGWSTDLGLYCYCSIDTAGLATLTENTVAGGVQSFTFATGVPRSTAVRTVLRLEVTTTTTLLFVDNVQVISNARGFSATTSRIDHVWFQYSTTTSGTLTTLPASFSGILVDYVNTLLATTTGPLGTPVVGDSTPPVLTGSITALDITSNAFLLNYPAATDNVAVTGYELSTNGGGSWIDLAMALSVVVVGMAPSTAYSVRVRAYDAAGNRSTALSATVTTTAVLADPSPPTPPATTRSYYENGPWELYLHDAHPVFLLDVLNVRANNTPVVVSKDTLTAFQATDAQHTGPLFDGTTNSIFIYSRASGVWAANGTVDGTRDGSSYGGTVACNGNGTKLIRTIPVWNGLVSGIYLPQQFYLTTFILSGGSWQPTAVQAIGPLLNEFSPMSDAAMAFNGQEAIVVLRPPTATLYHLMWNGTGWDVRFQVSNVDSIVYVNDDLSVIVCEDALSSDLRKLVENTSGGFDVTIVPQSQWKSTQVTNANDSTSHIAANISDPTGVSPVVLSEYAVIAEDVYEPVNTQTLAATTYYLPRPTLYANDTEEFLLLLTATTPTDQVTNLYRRTKKFTEVPVVIGTTDITGTFTDLIIDAIAVQSRLPIDGIQGAHITWTPATGLPTGYEFGMNGEPFLPCSPPLLCISNWYIRPGPPGEFSMASGAITPNSFYTFRVRAFDAKGRRGPTIMVAFAVDADGNVIGSGVDGSSFWSKFVQTYEAT
jgi:hypothetical protein